VCGINRNIFFKSFDLDKLVIKIVEKCEIQSFQAFLVGSSQLRRTFGFRPILFFVVDFLFWRRAGDLSFFQPATRRNDAL